MRSGLTFDTKLITKQVIIASPMPMKAWTPTIAGRTILNAAAPDMTNSIAQAKEAITTDNQAAMAVLTINPAFFLRR